MIKYRIAWKAIETGAIGSGQPIFRTKEAAQICCDDINTTDKGLLIHWVEPVEVPEEA